MRFRQSALQGGTAEGVPPDMNRFAVPGKVEVPGGSPAGIALHALARKSGSGHFIHSIAHADFVQRNFQIPAAILFGRRQLSSPYIDLKRR